MSLDYGRMGRIGILTPQANPTVEPEFNRLMQQEVAVYTARLVSREPDARLRLVNYLNEIEQTLCQFGGMPLDAIGFACTGSHYLVAPAHAARVFGEAERRFDTPLISAADAIKAMLKELGVRRISLLSPYPPWLTEAANAYWQSSGYQIGQTVRVGMAEGDTRPIYTLGAQDAMRSAEALSPGFADAVLVTGTGLPSLSILGPLSKRLNCPVLSSNLCLAQALTARVSADLKAQVRPRD